MHVIAQRLWVNTVKAFSLKVDSGRESLETPEVLRDRTRPYHSSIRRSSGGRSKQCSTVSHKALWEWTSAGAAGTPTAPTWTGPLLHSVAPARRVPLQGWLWDGWGFPRWSSSHRCSGTVVEKIPVKCYGTSHVWWSFQHGMHQHKAELCARNQTNGVNQCSTKTWITYSNSHMVCE